MDAPFDRGEIDRASLDATERLRARLSGRPPASPRPPRRNLLPWALAGGLFVFSAGMIANPWFEANVRSSLAFTEAESPAVEPAPNRPPAAATAPAPAEPNVPIPSERLARTEAQIENSTDQIARDAQRIDALTAQVASLTATLAAEQNRSSAATAAAVAASERAQAMLTLVLVRRAVDAGRPLGSLDPILRQSFARYPQAVQAVTALGTAPVTLTSLRRDFDALRPIIGAPPVTAERQTWWDTLTNVMSNAVSSPAAGTVQAAPEAAAALRRGDVIAAAMQLRRLPGPRPIGLANWLAAAERLHAGQLALGTLETATLLAPPVAIPVLPAAPAAMGPVQPAARQRITGSQTGSIQRLAIFGMARQLLGWMRAPLAFRTA